MFLVFVLIIIGILSGGNLHAVIKWRVSDSGIWQIGPWLVGVNQLTRRRCHVLVGRVRYCAAVA